MSVFLLLALVACLGLAALVATGPRRPRQGVLRAAAVVGALALVDVARATLVTGGNAVADGLLLIANLAALTVVAVLVIRALAHRTAPPLPRRVLVAGERRADLDALYGAVEKLADSGHDIRTVALDDVADRATAMATVEETVRRFRPDIALVDHSPAGVAVAAAAGPGTSVLRVAEPAPDLPRAASPRPSVPESTEVAA